jgi:hypothetical protein
MRKIVWATVSFGFGGGGCFGGGAAATGIATARVARTTAASGFTGPA